MESIRKADLLRLASIIGAECVSIYLPTYHGGDGQSQSAIRLRNLLADAREKLIANGMDALEARKFLAPVIELSESPTMWQGIGDGWAAFVRRNEVRVFRLASACPDFVIVGNRFHITSLIASVMDNRSFYVLAVSQCRVRLFHGSRDDLTEVGVPDLPASLAETLGATEAEVSLYFRTGQPQMRGKEALVFHGQGGEFEAFKPKLAAYARTIDQALASHLSGQSEPLIFAGVDYLFPIYRDENTYTHLLSTHVSGNPDMLSSDAIRHAAWSLVESDTRDRRAVGMATYWDVVTHGRTSNRLEEVLAAAQSGAVETLFIDPSERHFGSFDEHSLQTRIDEPPTATSEDLVNLAAGLVLTHGGAVESLPEGYIPGGGLIAAVMRYPLPPLQGNSGEIERELVPSR